MTVSFLIKEILEKLVTHIEFYFTLDDRITIASAISYKMGCLITKCTCKISQKGSLKNAFLNDIKLISSCNITPNFLVSQNNLWFHNFLVFLKILFFPEKNFRADIILFC